MKIHPTAIIDKSAELAEDVEVGPYAIVEADVTLGPRTKVGPHGYVGRWTEIGSDCEIHVGAVIGHEPMDLSYKGERSYLKVGDRNVFREYCFIHRGAKPESATIVGNDNYFMASSHAGHNVTIGNKVIVASTSMVAGHVVVEDNVFLSGHTGIHQFCRIGRLAFISGLSAVNQDVPPYMIAGGRPAEVSSLNREGLRRVVRDAHARKKLKEAFKVLFRSSLPVGEALEALEANEVTPEVRHLIDFIRSSRRGICRSSEWSRTPDRTFTDAASQESG